MTVSLSAAETFAVNRVMERSAQITDQLVGGYREMCAEGETREALFVALTTAITDLLPDENSIAALAALAISRVADREDGDR